MSAFLSELEKIVGANHIITGDAATPHYRDYRGRLSGAGLCVVRPENTDAVARVVKLCAQHNITITPQGGNTGLVGGSIPYDADRAIVLSTARLNKIYNVDAANFTMAVGAGCILTTVQRAADDADRYFPLSLGSEGSCQIGGNIAANAGGILTLRYGNTRDLVLGLEVVLPDGSVWDGLRALRKDNAGYDLKHMFIGSEGTLGIITAAVVKIFPKPKMRETFFVGLNSPADALALLARTRAAFADTIQAFELVPRVAIELANTHGPHCVDPLGVKAPWHILAEVTGVGRDALMAFLDNVMSDGIIVDATIAQNEKQRADLWFMREAIVEAQRNAGASIKHDISVPVSSIPDFIARADACVRALVPGVRPMIFGHVGDGNLHFNLTQPVGMDRAAYMARWDDVNCAVHDIVTQCRGSIAAEHGVGTFKASELAARKSPVELALMKTLKAALDPHNRMNPGKILN